METYKAFLETLPKKRMGAGCLFFDEQGRVLLVKPVYKPGWEIPGGVVELNESPRQGCEREVKEEIGLERKVGELLVVDYNHATDARTESLMFIFDGGPLSPAEIASIRLLPDELSEFQFFTPETRPPEMPVQLWNRVLMAWRQASGNQSVYLEDQQAL